MRKKKSSKTSLENISVKQSEKDIERAILEYLNLRPGCFAFKVNNGATFDPTRRCFRSKPGWHNSKGLADIIGIYLRFPLAIEVKTDVGRVSDDQTAFLTRFHSSGGISFVARSVADVEEVLDGIAQGQLSAGP